MRTFCILWQWFCPHFWTNRLYKNKESQGCKFGSVEAFIKRLTCVNQKCLLSSLVMQLVVKLLEPAWTSGLRWRRFFQSPQIQEQNTLKSTFHSLLHFHWVY